MKANTQAQFVIFKTREGWSLRKGDTVNWRGAPARIEGREGNLVLLRRFVAEGALPVKIRQPHEPVFKVHPTEVGLRSNPLPASIERKLATA